jgi:hypothetical protein
MPQEVAITLHEVQTSEAQRCTRNLLQKFRKDERQIENIDSHVEF